MFPMNSKQNYLIKFFHFSRLKSEDMQKHLNIRLEFLIHICCGCCSVAFIMVLCYNNNFEDDIGALLTRHETRHSTFNLRVGISRVLLQYNIKFFGQTLSAYKINRFVFTANKSYAYKTQSFGSYTV
uniref:Uncharacterized protein n=1 Tax=Glossina palpalis gambiensis TaxID=67801 RepID=A0A1B0B685_9MUSC